MYHSCISLHSLLTLCLPSETQFCLTKPLKSGSLLHASLESKRNTAMKVKVFYKLKNVHRLICTWTQSCDCLEACSPRTAEVKWWKPFMVMKARKADKLLLSPGITIHHYVHENSWQQPGGLFIFLYFFSSEFSWGQPGKWPEQKRMWGVWVQATNAESKEI